MSKFARPLSILAASLSIIAGTTTAQDVAKPTAIEGTPAAKAPQAPTPKAETVLKVGDPAPKFSVEKIIKGNKNLKSLEKGKVYVVEFWATWCGPCIAAFPHLTEVAKKHKDAGVEVIGVNVWEDGQSPYTPETLKTIEAFVEDQGEKMGYTVAYDGGSKAMADGWMKAANQNGIPHAFVVNKEGIIAWMGHPMAMDKPLEQIVAGTFDIAKAAKDAADEAAARKALRPLERRFSEAVSQDKWDDAVKAAEEMAALPIQSASAQGVMTKFMVLLRGKKDSAAAYAMKDAILAHNGIKDNAQTLNRLAWTVVDPEADLEAKDRNADFAIALASRAAEVTKHEDGTILDTLAWAYFVKGDKAKAVEWQTKAIAVTKDTEMLEQLKASLEEFKK